MVVEITPPVPTPEVPPVAPAAPTTTPPLEELDFNSLAKKAGLGWLYDTFGGDDTLLAYIQNHPGDLETTMRMFGTEESSIDTAEELKLFDITRKMGLLIIAQFKSFGQKPSNSAETVGADTTLLEQLKDKGKTLTFPDFKSFWTTKGGLEAPLFLDSLPHAIWRGEPHFDWPKLETFLGANKGPEALKLWPEMLPPAGSRVVMDQTPEALKAIVDAPAHATLLEPMGLKLVLVAPGTVPAAPKENEIQIVGLQDVEPMTVDAAKAAMPLWDEATVPTQFEGAPKTLATIQALKEKEPYSTPEDICKKVGLTTPDQPFLDFLKTVHA